MKRATSKPAKAKRHVPINESSGTPSRSRLTKEQKKQMETAVYGLPQKESNAIMEHDPNALTPGDIEKMRSIVYQYDRSTGKVTEFDLNRPPQDPIAFRPFPRLLYNHETHKEKPVADEEQLAKALKEGWKKEAWPHYGEAIPAPQLSASAAAEAHETNIKIAEARRKEEELRQQQEREREQKTKK